MLICSEACDEGLRGDCVLTREVGAKSEAVAGAGARVEVEVEAEAEVEVEVEVGVGVEVEVEAVLMKLSRRSGCTGGDDLIDSVARTEEGADRFGKGESEDE